MQFDQVKPVGLEVAVSLMLSRQLEARLDIDTFHPDIVRARSTTNIDLLRHGIFTT